MKLCACILDWGKWVGGGWDGGFVCTVVTSHHQSLSIHITTNKKCIVVSAADFKKPILCKTTVTASIMFAQVIYAWFMKFCI